jgi:hypothetical protein
MDGPVSRELPAACSAERVEAWLVQHFVQPLIERMARTFHQIPAIRYLLDQQKIAFAITEEECLITPSDLLCNRSILSIEPYIVLTAFSRTQPTSFIGSPKRSSAAARAINPDYYLAIIDAMAESPPRRIRVVKVEVLPARAQRPVRDC